MRWTPKSIRAFANGICQRGYASDAGWERLQDYEVVVHDVCVTLWWMEGWPSLAHFFESGFDAEQISDAFDAIGHRMAAATVRHANLLYRISPEHDDLDTLGRALYAMQESIYHRLSSYLRGNHTTQ